MTPSIDHILHELATCATPRMKKYYLSKGVCEPVFGTPTGAMKPIARPLKGNQAIAEALYATAVFDAMYLAGMICDVDTMTPADFRRWMDQAYCAFIAESVVAVSLAEASCAQALATEFIESPRAIAAAGGWSCYEWLLGSRKDHEFDSAHISQLLERVVRTISQQPSDVQSAMQRMVVAVGVSYQPLHTDALACAHQLAPFVAQQIQHAAIQGRIGFKRRHVRC